MDEVDGVDVAGKRTVPAVAWWQRLRLSEDRVRALPGLAALWCYLAGALPVALVALGDCGPRTAVLFGAGGVLAAGLVLPVSHLRRYLGLVAVGVVVAAWQAHLSGAHYTRVLGQRDAFAEIRGIVVETRLPEAAELQWLGPPRGIAVQLQSLRFSRQEPWQATSGLVLLLRDAPDCHYGQTVQATGSFRVPPAPFQPGLFNYQRYLRTNRVWHFFESSELTVVAEARGWRRVIAGCLHGREFILARLLARITDDTAAQMLAAIALGQYLPMDRMDREAYLRSGTIHLFAISGINVGLLFVSLMLILGACRVPFGPRHLLAPLLVLAYVLAAGAEPSAMRAWLMLAVWSAGRGLRLPMAPLNAVLLAAWLLLLWNPWYLFQSGFQFSFVIVAALVLGWSQGHAVLQYLDEHLLWVPLRARSQGWLTWHLRGLRRGLLSLGVAWLAGIGLTAVHNHLFLPVSLAANLVLSVLAWPVMVLSLGKLVLGLPLLGWADGLAAGALTHLLELVRGLALVTGAPGPWVIPVAHPPLGLVLAYYAVLLALLLAAGELRWVFRWSAVLVVLVLVMVVHRGDWRADGLPAVLLPAGADQPVVVLAGAESSAPVLVNSGPARFAAPLLDWLRAQGIGELDTVVLLDTAPGATGTLPEVLTAIPVRSVVLVAPSDHPAKAVTEATWRRAARWRRGVPADGIALPWLTVEATDGQVAVGLRLPLTASDLRLGGGAAGTGQLVWQAPGREAARTWHYTLSNTDRLLVP